MSDLPKSPCTEGRQGSAKVRISISPIWIFLSIAVVLVVLYIVFAQHLYGRVIPGAGSSNRSTSMKPVKFEFEDTWKGAAYRLRLAIPEAYLLDVLKGGESTVPKITILAHWPTRKPLKVVEAEQGLVPEPIALFHNSLIASYTLISLTPKKGEFSQTAREQFMNQLKSTSPLTSEFKGLSKFESESCDAECKKLGGLHWIDDFYLSERDDERFGPLLISCKREGPNGRSPACVGRIFVNGYRVEFQFSRESLASWDSVAANANALIRSFIAESVKLPS